MILPPWLELVDATDLKSGALCVRVRVPLGALACSLADRNSR